MKRVYYSLVPLDYRRPGGVWWYRDIADHELHDWVDILKPVATAIRVCCSFPNHDPMAIEPPSDSIELM